MNGEQVLQMFDQIMRSGKAVDAQLALMREVNRAYELSQSAPQPSTSDVSISVSRKLVRYADLRASGGLSGWRTVEREPEAIGYSRDPIMRTVKFVEA